MSEGVTALILRYCNDAHQAKRGGDQAEAAEQVGGDHGVSGRPGGEVAEADDDEVSGDDVCAAPSGSLAAGRVVKERVGFLKSTVRPWVHSLAFGGCRCLYKIVQPFVRPSQHR